MTKPDVLVFSPVYDEEVMHKIGTNYNLLRLDRVKDKTTFLEKHGSKCQTLIINGHTELNQTHVNSMPNLKLVVCSSAGYELMDTTTLQNRNIKLTNTAAALFDDVADMAILMILASMRNLVRGHDYVASQRWAEKGMFPLQSSLKGKHLGLVGFGKIGQAIAKRAAVFGPNIAYHSRSKNPASGLHYFSGLADIALWADILVVVVPGGQETENMINEEIIEKLGSSGVLVNLSRGSVLDETSLITALKTEKLGHAALDVYKNEPRPNPEMIALDRITLYPHHASGTRETRARMSELVHENLDAFYAGKPLITPVF